MRLRRRDFPEVRDNLLTSITGGVAAEALPFPPPGVDEGPFRYSLSRAPARALVSVYGSLNGETHLFRSGQDVRLSEDGRTLEWPAGAGSEVPDDGSVFHVNYHPTGTTTGVTDVYTGSVVRTLAESVALEMARLYAQLEAIYKAAFIDTSTGRSLENLVALLGIERIQGGRAGGEIEFQRSAGSKGAVNIPSGTRVMTPDGDIEYETIADVTMNPDQNSVRVLARDLEQNDPVDAGALTVMPVPIAGIGTVTNPAPSAITTRDETDEELRTRTRNVLHGSERATLGSIEVALRRQGVTADVVEVRASSEGAIDRVEVTPHYEGSDPELEQRLERALEEVRPAGVVVKLMGAVAPRPVHLELLLTTRQDLLERDRRAVQRSVSSILEDLLGRLPSGEDVSLNRLVGKIMTLPEIEDVTFVSATTPEGGADLELLDREAGVITLSSLAAPLRPARLGDLRITDPLLPSRVRALIDHSAAEPAPVAAEVARLLTDELARVSADNETASTAGGALPSLAWSDLVATIELSPAPTGPYTIRFSVARETGEARILSGPTDSYELSPFERLTVDGVEVTEVEA